MELDILEGLVAELGSWGQADPEHLRTLHEKVLTLKLLRKLQAKEVAPKPPVWQSEWFWRFLVLVAALIIGVTDLGALVKGWIP